jgi:xanthine dehydrogenase accessory factor
LDLRNILTAAVEQPRYHLPGANLGCCQIYVDMSELYYEIHQTIKYGKDLVLATIIDSRGSTPRTSGSKMIVYVDGAISGTIGGGAVEADIIRIAVDLLQIKKSLICSYDLNQPANLDQMDLICGGHMQVLLEYVAASRENVEMYATLCDEMDSFHPYLLIGKVQKYGDHCQLERAIGKADGRVTGPLEMTADFQASLQQFMGNKNKTVIATLEQTQYVIETVVPPDAVYIIGGGHVSKEIALLTKQVGFTTLVFDDRPEFADIKRFPGVDEVYVCPDFGRLFDNYAITPRCSIIIVTRGHHSDREVLAQALQTEAGYIGMIGSRRKRESIYKALRGQGVKNSALERVYCPIGLPIQAETPAEIGVSVVAQLIQHRAGRKRHV